MRTPILSGCCRTGRRPQRARAVNANRLGRKALSEQDLAEWLAFARQVRPLPGRNRPPPPIAAPVLADASRAERASARLPPSPARAAAGALAVGKAPAGLDSSSWNRLRSGRLAPTRSIDLHGRTIHRAYHALHAFLHAAHAERVRCVEVITGRGAADSGAIRRELPMWLNLPALRPLVLAAVHPHTANPGAVLLLLRRPK